jgi:hypothetical protein
VSVQNEFSPAFSTDFDPPDIPVVPRKMLVFPKGVDDHSRPRLPLWHRYRYQPTQLALLLYEDGRVIETDTLYRDEFLDADDVAAGGHQSIYDQDAWQVGVLTAAGYTLVDVVDAEVPEWS